MHSVRFLVICLTVVAGLAAGCGRAQGGDGRESTELATQSPSSWALLCVDQDGDGYGANCGGGADCDDTDSAHHDGCDVCTARSAGCECEPGSEPMPCTLDKQVTAQGSLLCRAGVQYCQDGRWTQCLGVARFEIPPPNTPWVSERVSAESDPDTQALRCDPCEAAWGPELDGR